MTDVEFVELRKIAENATPGPWEWAPPSDESWPMEDESLETSWIGEHGYKEMVLSGWGHSASGTAAEPQDREFIATFNPERVLGLLDRLERAVAALQRVRELHYSFDHRGYGLCAECTVEEYPTDWPCPTVQALGGDAE